MLKQVLVGIFTVTALSGCINTGSLSGDTYTASQAKQVQTVTYGTVTRVIPVNIQAGGDENIIGALGGAVLGGLLGNTVGGGTGKTLATAAGGVAGQNVQGALNKTKGVQLEIRLDNGRVISVVQKGDPNSFRNGQRVSIIGSGNNITVSPR